MNPKEDEELIITNDEPQEVPSSGNQAMQEGPDAPGLQLNEEQEFQEIPDNNEAPEEQKTFTEILNETVSEEDAPLQSSMTLIKILGGEFFTAQVLKRQIWLILLIAAFTVIYISNRYSCQKSQIEVDKLNKELSDAKYRALATSSELTEVSRESNVLNVLKAIGDSDIHVSDQPPYLIKVPETEKK